MVWLKETVGLAEDKACEYAAFFAAAEFHSVDEITDLSMTELKNDLQVPFGICRKLQPFLK